MGRRPEFGKGRSRRPGRARSQWRRREDFQLTSAVLPVHRSQWEPCQGWRIETYCDEETSSEIPTLAAAVSEEILFDVFLALLDRLGQVVDVVLESSHDGSSDVPRDFLREHIDRPVFLSYLLQFRELVMEDGCLGIAVVDPAGPCELQLDDHKILLVYSRKLERFIEVFERFEIERDDDLTLISEQEHIHSTFPHHAKNLETFRTLLHAEPEFPQAKG